MQVKNYSVPFMISIIQNRYKIGESRFFKADLSASDMLIDLDSVIDKANLTDKQKYIMEHYWIRGFTQEEVAKTMGITQQMCEKHSRAIKKKIKKILQDMGEIDNDKK